MAHHEDIQPREFTCRDCGDLVVQIIPTHDNDQDLCCVCIFLRGIDEEKDRNHLRSMLRKTKLFSGGHE